MQTLEVTLTNELYQQVKARAGHTNRTVEAEVVAAVEALLATDAGEVGLPQPLTEELAQLAFLDDTHLWQAARQVASTEKMSGCSNWCLNNKPKG